MKFFFYTSTGKVIKPAEKKPAKHTHLQESTLHRRSRLESSGCHAQPLCSTGDAHAWVSTDDEQVTCPTCLELLQEYPNAAENKEIAKEIA